MLKKSIYLVLALALLLAACDSSKDHQHSHDTDEHDHHDHSGHDHSGHGHGEDTVDYSNIDMSGDMDFGTIQNGRYQNQFFGFSMQVSDYWGLDTDSVHEVMTMFGKELKIPMNDTIDALDTALVGYATLLLIHSAGDPDEPTGATFEVLVNNLKAHPYINTAQKFLYDMKMRYDGANPDATSLLVVDPLVIGEHQFYIYEYEEPAGDSLPGLKETYYAAELNGFALVFYRAWYSDAQGDQLDKLIQSVRFN